GSANHPRKAHLDRSAPPPVSLVLPGSLGYPAGSGPVLPDMQASKVLLFRNGFSTACWNDGIAFVPSTWADVSAARLSVCSYTIVLHVVHHARHRQAAGPAH